MWKTVFEVFKRLFTINDELNRVQAELKRQGEQIRQLAENQMRFQYEQQLQNERSVHEREKVILELENRLLRERLEQRILPPPSDKKSDEE
ncbi:MAG: hypothetical protein JST85_21435 [Acidobacteria bacterium]|nr:hypothetical protein [Acidobacteriota bacterium]